MKQEEKMKGMLREKKRNGNKERKKYEKQINIMVENESKTE